MNILYVARNTMQLYAYIKIIGYELGFSTHSLGRLIAETTLMLRCRVIFLKKIKSNYLHYKKGTIEMYHIYTFILTWLKQRFVLVVFTTCIIYFTWKHLSYMISLGYFRFRKKIQNQQYPTTFPTTHVIVGLCQD